MNIGNSTEHKHSPSSREAEPSGQNGSYSDHSDRSQKSQSSRDEAPVVVSKTVSQSLYCPFVSKNNERHMLVNPVICQCGHTFCLQCAKNADECPIDKTHLIQPFTPNLIISEQLEEVMIYCRHGLVKVVDSDGAEQWVRTPDGCPETIPLRTRLSHERDCGFALVPCPNSTKCGHFRRRMLPYHLMEECMFRPCPAAPYGCSFRGPEKALSAHIQQCPLHQISPFIALNTETTNQLQRSIEQIMIRTENLEKRSEESRYKTSHSVDEFKEMVCVS
eukprot:GCRY01007766.1.p1 GENE.GCRY01007766.1~~GCRY01007766.1.p1  ORF type:complete len:276 (-),score=28.04 GCRY01007766.1:7-834(-)